MADDPALRARRSRRHKQGQHDLCVPGRCEALAGTVRSVPDVTAALETPSPAPVTHERDVPPPAQDREQGRIEKMAVAFVATLPYADGDPRRMIAELAVELGRRIDETGAAPAAIRELRMMLMQLAEAPSGPAGAVDEIRLRHHQQQLDAILATA